MRDYVTKQNIGGLPDSLSATKYGAGEINSILTENENAVSRSGQTLASADGTAEDTTQLAQSLFLHGGKSTSFVASGTADAIVLVPVSGSSGVLLPADYTNLDGQRMIFLPTAANTGVATVDIGQTVGSLLGTKALLTFDGSALSGGEIDITAFVEVKFDSSADSSNGGWLITSAAAAAGGGGFTLGTPQATTSGTSFNFGSIPSGTTKIDVSFDGNVTASASGIGLQIGDAGGIETTGYISTAIVLDDSSNIINAFSSTAGLFNAVQAGADIMTGHIFLTLSDASTNTWIASYNAGLSGGDDDRASFGGGSKSLSGELTQLTITAPSGEAFSAGSVNVQFI